MILFNASVDVDPKPPDDDDPDVFMLVFLFHGCMMKINEKNLEIVLGRRKL